MSHLLAGMIAIAAIYYAAAAVITDAVADATAQVAAARIAASAPDEERP